VSQVVVMNVSYVVLCSYFVDMFGYVLLIVCLSWSSHGPKLLMDMCRGINILPGSTSDVS
jgi:hypothetical protein